MDRWVVIISLVLLAQYSASMVTTNEDYRVEVYPGSSAGNVNSSQYQINLVVGPLTGPASGTTYKIDFGFLSSPNFYYKLIEGALTDRLEYGSQLLLEKDIPVWISSNDFNTVEISSNLTRTINATTSFDVSNCTIERLDYVSDSGAHSYSIYSTEPDLSCTNNRTTANISFIEPATGSNTITVVYQEGSTTTSTSTTSTTSTSTSSTSTTSTTISATTTLNPPVLISPEDGTTTSDHKPTFTWSSSPQASGYVFALDDETSFSTPLIENTLAVTYYTPTNPLEDGVYYWRAESFDGQNSFPADYRQLTITDQLITKQFSLAAGWNLVPMPLSADRYADDVCTDISSTGATPDVVRRWVPSLQEYQTHSCAVPEYLNFIIYPGEAVWAYSLDPTNISISGLATNSTRSLGDGWNLIAWPFITYNTSAEALGQSLGANAVVKQSGTGYTCHPTYEDYNDFQVSWQQGLWVHKGSGILPSTETPKRPQNLVGEVYWSDGTRVNTDVGLINLDTEETLSTTSSDGWYEFDIQDYSWNGNTVKVYVTADSQTLSTEVYVNESSGCQVAPDIVFVSSGTSIIRLSQGWNLISLPKEVENT